APVVSPTPPPVPAGGRAGDVMQRHLQLMQHFLEMHENVVLAYLGQPRPAAALPERPVPALDLHVGNGKAALPPQEILPEPQVVVPAAPEPPPIVVAAPPAPPAPAPPAATNGHHPAAQEDLSERLLAIVSERTGYPLDMLELDADLEADLGIDSIKRVEIVGTMIQALSLKDGVTPDVEEITSSRTLRQA